MKCKFCKSTNLELTKENWGNLRTNDNGTHILGFCFNCKKYSYQEVNNENLKQCININFTRLRGN